MLCKSLACASGKHKDFIQQKRQAGVHFSQCLQVSARARHVSMQVLLTVQNNGLLKFV